MWLLFSLICLAASGAADPEPPRHTIVDKGIRVTFDATRVAAPDSRGESFQEGDAVRFRFTLTDPAGKVPIRGANTRAWLSLRADGEIPAANTPKIKASRFITGGVFGQADLDLNSFYVLALNSDATISVVDPLFGFGNTKLLALIPLPANGYDWVLTQDQAKLFVSIPEKKQIAVIDTSRWEVLHIIEAGLRPARLALQPDEQYLWAAGEGASDTALAAFRADTFAPAATLPIGHGHHAMAITRNSTFLVVANGEDDSISIIDTRALTKAKEIKIGRGPVAAAYSELADTLYVCAAGAGEIAVLDAKTLALTKTIRTKPGLADIAAAPGGRHLLAVNRKTDTVEVIDASSAEIIQTGTVGKAPFQITFSGDLAYINHLGSSEVFMLPLSQLGRRGQPLSVVTFPAGEHPLGDKWSGSPAARIVPIPGEAAVLVADTRGRAIYFYKEGMAAPMGTFSNYKREPMAVQVIDRSLRERGTAGVYETVAKLGKPGIYDVIFFLDSPKIVEGFQLAVAPNPKLDAERNAPKVVITPLAPTTPAKGATATFRFRVMDKQTNEPVTGIRDMVIVIMAPGNWHERQVAKEEGDGVYAVTVTPPEAGVYYAHAQCLSLNVQFGNPHYPVLRIAPASSVSAAANKNE
jgi:YVTN family beta-propeller protein